MLLLHYKKQLSSDPGNLKASKKLLTGPIRENYHSQIPSAILLQITPGA